MIEPTTVSGTSSGIARGITRIFEDKKRRRVYTLNLVPGQRVYGEVLVQSYDQEYREWNPYKSKLCAAYLKGIKGLALEDGAAVLYLGVSSGTTASHVSDIVSRRGIVFGIDFSPVSLRQLVFVAEQRRNLVPILADATHPEQYVHRICECDILIQDIAQKNQLDIFLKNLALIKPSGCGILSVKSRSIDVTQQPRKIYEYIKAALEKHLNLIDWKTLDPFEKDHALFVVTKRE